MFSPNRPVQLRLSDEHLNVLMILTRADRYETGLRETGRGDENIIIGAAMSHYSQKEERRFFKALLELERWGYVDRLEAVDPFDSAYYVVTWELTELGGSLLKDKTPPSMFGSSDVEVFDSFGDPQREYEDGTNIPAGTLYQEGFTPRFLPWYVPSQSKAGPNWKENLGKLRSRFDSFIDEHCTAECYLVQTLIPQIGEFPGDPPGILLGRQLLRRGPGLRKEPARLFGAGNSVDALFPISNVRGEPFLEPNGKPTPFRLGLARYITVKAVPDELRPLPVPKLTELLGDGKNIVFQLPPKIATKIWSNWQAGFSQRDSDLIWLDMLFELAWQREKGSPFHTDRFAWSENSSIALAGKGLFPRLPKFITATPGDFCPNENGYPRAIYSKIADIARASIATIDEILEFDSMPLKNQESERFGNRILGRRNKVFISYSHTDKKFLDALLTHLKPFERSGQLTSWSDEQIEPGSKWFDEIQKELSEAKVGVLLVSANFLASNFIYEHELTPLLKKAEADGVLILWIPVRACAYRDTPIQKYQAIISPDKPLAEMKADRDKAWVRICEEIQKAVAK